MKNIESKIRKFGVAPSGLIWDFPFFCAKLKMPDLDRWTEFILYATAKYIVPIITWDAFLLKQATSHGLRQEGPWVKCQMPKLFKYE